MKKGEQPSSYYPLFLNISGKKCVVVGGGQVALRKVRTLLEHSARVDVISPDLCLELVHLAEGGSVRVLNREYRAGDLADAFVAIAATDNKEVNQQIVQEARRNRVLVNAVDDAEGSDFIVPAYLRRGEVAIAISTTGRSPALARKIRTKLEKDLGEEYALLLRLIGEVRAEIKQRGIKVDSDDWQEALDIDLLLELLRRGEKKKAKNILLGNLESKNNH